MPVVTRGSYTLRMTRPKPIRYDVDTWLVIRNDPVIPKAVIQRVHHKEGDRYLLFKWDLDPAQRQLMSVVDSLGAADELVRYDAVEQTHLGPPNGRNPDGSMWVPPPRSGAGQ